jgi:hypothetical protein
MWQNENYFRETMQMDRRRWKVQENLFVNTPIFRYYIIKVIHKCVNLQPQNSCCHLCPVHTVCPMAFILVTTCIALIQLSKWNLIFLARHKQFLPALWQHNHRQAQQNKINCTYWPHTNTGRTFTALIIIILDVKCCSVDRYQHSAETYCFHFLGWMACSWKTYAKTDGTLSQNMIIYTCCNEYCRSDTFSVRSFFRQLCQWMISRRSTFACHDY